MDKFEQELCGNNAMKGKIDRKSKPKTFSETWWFSSTNALATVKAAFHVTVSGLKYLKKTMVTANQASINLSFCDLTLFYH